MSISAKALSITGIDDRRYWSPGEISKKKVIFFLFDSELVMELWFSSCNSCVCSFQVLGLFF